MNCPRCNTPVNMQMNRCQRCGQNLQTYKKAVRISASLYNEGLDKARVRDLSGAVETLEKSLVYYKGNTNARNLLGLVYYELGETVKALTQWILSKNISPEGNEADYYIDSIQSNPQALDNAGLTIKKYNSALAAAKQGNEDLAIIQLKKVVSLTPNFVRGQQLIALLYMMIGENDKAKKHLKKAARVDVNNTTTLKYIEELGGFGDSDDTSSDKKNQTPERKIFKGDSSVEVKEVGSYKPERTRAFPFINVIIGVIIGLFVGLVLVMPTISSKSNQEKANEISEYGTKLAERDSQIASMQHEKETLDAQVQSLTNQLNEALNDDSLSAAQVYEKIIEAYKMYTEGDKAQALATVMGLDMSEVTNETAKDIVNTISSEDTRKASADAFEKGRKAYNSGKYDDAKKYLQEAVDLNKDNVDAIYFFGRLYHKQGNKEKATEYYRKVVKDYPDSERVSEARSRLNELGVSE